MDAGLNNSSARGEVSFFSYLRRFLRFPAAKPSAKILIKRIKQLVVKGSPGLRGVKFHGLVFSLCVAQATAMKSLHESSDTGLNHWDNGRSITENYTDIKIRPASEINVGAVGRKGYPC